MYLMGARKIRRKNKVLKIPLFENQRERESFFDVISAQLEKLEGMAKVPYLTLRSSVINFLP